MALWKSQTKEHTSDWLMPCSACSKVFAGDIYGDHAVLCADIVGTHGELDGVISLSEELDTPKLVKLVKMGPSGELDGAPTLSDGQDTTKTVETNLVILRQSWFHAILDLTSVLTLLLLLGLHGELDGVISPPDELDTSKLVKLVKMGPSGELDGTPTLPDGRDTTKTVETNLVILRRSWFHAILDLTLVLTPSLLLVAPQVVFRSVVILGVLHIKHRHNIVRDTLVEICFRFGISAGKEVDIGLGLSPLTQTGMIDFVPGRALIEVAQRKRIKYKANGCHDGGGKGLTKTSLITHLHDRHCNGNAQAITRQYLSTNLAVFEEVGVTFKRMTHVPSSSEQLDLDDDLVQVQHGGFTLALLASGSLQLIRETLAESSPPLSGVDDKDLDLVLSSSGVASYNDATLDDLKTKHPFKHAPSLPHIPINHHQIVASQDVVLDKIKSFPHGTSCARDGLRAQHLMDCLSGAAVAISDYVPLTPLVELGGGIRLIVVDDLQFGVGVSGRGEAILYSVNRLIECRGDDVGLSMLLVDYKNAFNLVDREIRDSFILSLQAWYLDDGTIIGDTLIVGKVLELIMEDGPSYFSSELVMKRVTKTIVLMDTVESINDPQFELLLLRACVGISKLYFAMRTCSPPVFEMAQRSFDVALCSALERDVLNYAFLASRFQSASLQTNPLRHSIIVVSGSTFDDALCVPIFSILKPCPACSRVFRGIFLETMSYIMPVSLALNIGITLYVIPLSTYVLGRGFRLDSGRDVCVDLIGSSPLTQIGMVDFVPGRAVTDATHRKRVKYETECSDIGYGFLPFSFYSLGELENAVMALLKRIHTLVFENVLELIIEDDPRCGLHLNHDKIKVFFAEEDPRSKLTSVFSPNITRPLHGVKLLGRPTSVDFDFSTELVMKRVAKIIMRIEAVCWNTKSVHH
ncbi:hypothetical protein Tco_1132655 [Tanacetum coccineum]|uniref:Uncharacterized protein n=1 Tax=Tanacetum coccineum TaxID=301880 RepID=A0ABQ5JGM9_9ASTR